MMNESRTYTTRYLLLGSAGINLIYFLIFLLLTSPIYNTNEDVYILYLLSGGFGNEPTELLHYRYEVHPYIGLILKNLFVLNGNINWYSLLLILMHFIGSTIILFQLLLKYRKKNIVLIYTMLFLLFECGFLLTLNFTNTAIILCCAAIVLIFENAENKRNSINRCITAVLLIVMASCFRFLVIIPLIALALPVIILRFPFKKTLQSAGILLFAGIGVLFFNYLLTRYYKSSIAGWAGSENYRQHVYDFYNNNTIKYPVAGEKWFSETTLIRNGLLIDTSYLPASTLSLIGNELKKKPPVNRSSIYWFFMNTRIYLCALLVLIFCVRIKKRSLYALLVCTASLVVGFMILIYTHKLPGYLILSGFFLPAILILLSSEDELIYRKRFFLLHIVSTLIIIWSVIRIYKLNKVQLSAIRNFRTSYSEISAHPEKLFIGTSDAFPLQKFYIMDVASKFPLKNFIGSEHFLNHSDEAVLKRFNIASFHETPASPQVLFYGQRIPGLEEYFEKKNGKKISVSAPLKDFKSAEVYRIQFLDNNHNIP